MKRNISFIFCFFLLSWLHTGCSGSNGLVDPENDNLSNTQFSTQENTQDMESEYDNKIPALINPYVRSSVKIEKPDEKENEAESHEINEIPPNWGIVDDSNHPVNDKLDENTPFYAIDGTSYSVSNLTGDDGETLPHRSSDWFFIDSFDIDYVSLHKNSAAGKTGHTELECKIFLPEGPPPYNFLLIGHGWPSEASDMVGFAEKMQQKGYGCLIWSSRGFGRSTEIARLNSPEYEVKDVIRIINWLSVQDFVIREKHDPEKYFENGKLVDFDFNSDGKQEDDDIPGNEDLDFRLGMVGASYGGAIQLLTASFDRRIDVIAPWITWNNLFESLVPSDTLKINWAFLFYIGAIAKVNTAVDPLLTECLTTILMTNEPSPLMLEQLNLRSPSNRIDKIKIPTLVVQGEIDTMFDLNQSIRTYNAVLKNGNETKLIWNFGGHSYLDFGSMETIFNCMIPWVDKYLKGEDVDTGPDFEYELVIDEDTKILKSGSFPLVKKKDETIFNLHAGDDTISGTLIAADEPYADEYQYEPSATRLRNKAFVNSSINETFLAPTDNTEENDSENTEQADKDVMLMFMNMLSDAKVTRDDPETSAVFNLPPFESATEITGVPHIDIFLSADISDIIFFFKFYDVAPDGTTTFIDLDVTPIRLPVKDSENHENSGIAEEFYHSGLFQQLNDFFYDTFIEGTYFEKFLGGIPQFGISRKGDLTDPQRYSADLRAFTHYFKKGHSLRFIISTSQFGYVHSRKKGNGFIWHNATHISQLSLPIVKN